MPDWRLNRLMERRRILNKWSQAGRYPGATRQRGSLGGPARRLWRGGLAPCHGVAAGRGCLRTGGGRLAILKRCSRREPGRLRPELFRGSHACEVPGGCPGRRILRRWRRYRYGDGRDGDGRRCGKRSRERISHARLRVSWNTPASRFGRRERTSRGSRLGFSRPGILFKCGGRLAGSGQASQHNRERQWRQPRGIGGGRLAGFGQASRHNRGWQRRQPRGTGGDRSAVFEQASQHSREWQWRHLRETGRLRGAFAGDPLPSPLERGKRRRAKVGEESG